MDRGAWRTAVHRVTQSRRRLKQLSMHPCIGEGNGNPLQYSCLENPRDKGAWWAAVYGVAQSRTRLKQLSSSSSSSSTYNLLSSKYPGGSDGKESAYSVGDPGSILGSRRSLKKEMATHSSFLAWRIPWTEEPGRL